MKRRNFIKNSSVLAAATGLTATQMAAAATKPTEGREVYELRTYAMKSGGKLNVIGNYVKNALTPAVNRLGGKVGAFTEYGKTDPPIFYLLITYPDWATFGNMDQSLGQDATYQAAAKDYLMMAPEQADYFRYQTATMEAFEGISQHRAPGDMEAGLYEHRIYESYNEDAHRRKVAMFNEGELAIFDETGLHSVFFGDNRSGDKMPCLTYMLRFKDMAQRDENWARFIASPKWDKMKNMPEYAHTVSQVNRIFLLPTDYSQI